MHTQLSANGNLVIPKPIRDVLALAPGTSFSAEVVDGNILLRPSVPETSNSSAWRPRNPGSQRLSTKELCQPVALSDQ